MKRIHVHYSTEKNGGSPPFHKIETEYHIDSFEYNKEQKTLKMTHGKESVVLNNVTTCVEF